MTLPEGQILTQNLDFRGYISTIRAKNTLESWAFKAKNNAQTTSEHPQNNFQKVQKTTFLAPKMKWSNQGYQFCRFLAKVSIFSYTLDLKAQILPQKCSNRF